MPADSVRDYYGEKIALYFCFLEEYTNNLFVIGLIGLGVFLVQLLAGEASVLQVVFNILFGMIKNIWSSYFLYGWRRREKFLSTRWGTLGGSIKSLSDE